LEVFLESFYSVSWVQWLASFLAVIYILLAYKNSSACFLFGLLSALLWAYESYINLDLKFDAALQIFYALMSIYGLYIWKYGGENKSEKPISFLGLKGNLMWIISGLIITLIVYYWAIYYVESSRTFLDIFTTVYSLIATILLVHRYMENWILFVIVDLLYVYIYYLQGGYVFALMMIIYIFMSFASWFNWKRIYLETI